MKDVGETKGTVLIDGAPWRGRVFCGGWRPAAQTYTVRDKSTGEVLGEVGRATVDDLRAAAEAASAAQPAWAAAAPDQRATVFRRAAALLEQHSEEATRWNVRESGGLRVKAGMELRSAVQALHAAAAMMSEPQGIVMPSVQRLSYARRVPHGVVGVIAPFNFPLTLSMRAVAPALATGNAVILKPDPQTAVCGGVLLARLFEEAGLPAGLFHMLPGGADVGEALCTHPRVGMVAFTGSTAAGRRVGALCGEHLKKVSLELGGKNALIVLEDADLERAAACAAFGAWMHQGQICMATGRVLAHRSIAGELAQRLAARAHSLRVGNPLEDGVQMGPLINDRQIDSVHAIVQDSIAAGATLLAGGSIERPFYRPTVLDGVRPGMRVFEEEVFGPVAAVTSFESEDEAVALANRTEYGLSAAVISRSVGRAMAIGNRMRTGLLHINDQTIVSDAHAPFGGRGISGNGSRVGGPANWDEFTQWQWVTIRETPPDYPV
jgi:benzaldehyde dehydrogenase (NAD)